MTQRLVFVLDPCTQVHITEIWSEHWRTRWGCSARQPKCSGQTLPAGKYKERGKAARETLAPGFTDYRGPLRRKGCLPSILGYVFSLLLALLLQS